MALREKNGLISTTTGLQTDDFLRSIRFKGQIRDIVDWPHTGILGLGKKQGGEDDRFAFTDYNVVTNAWHYAALKQMEGIAGALGKQDDVAFYASESDAFKNGSSVRSLMFVRGISRMVLLPTPTMLPYMAICSRWRSIWFRPERSKNVVDFIQTRGMACSVYSSQFLMDALYEANDAEYALHMLTKTDDRSWYNMIRVGSTISLEAWDNKYKPNQDWNHAWGAAPANIIPRRLMGVEPLRPVSALPVSNRSLLRSNGRRQRFRRSGGDPYGGGE